ncbi:MAG: CoA transferase [Xanthobacteraceae bacterium]|jgi:crotonobetainyl-CoA:carnitine CoA-transferase CaiB-like acyl-CoA transferase
MLPLSGVKVIELGQNIAGPYAGEILATLGADVVKVERPGSGDDARYWGTMLTPDATHLFHSLNLNKRSIALDLTDAAAVAWVKRYIGECDVVVQNLRPGVVEELGLDAATLRAACPRLVYCSVGAFGNAGPMRMMPGYEPIVQAFAGIFSVNGGPDSPPSRVGLSILDMGSGLWAALGCIAALYQRERTGTGCVVETSLFETALGWLATILGGYKTSGVMPPRHRTGSPRIVVFQGFETTDGEIVVAAANDRLFAKLAEAVGRPDWSQDPRFRTNALRVANKDVLIPQVAALMRQRSRAEWAARLEAAGIPCAPINDLAEVAENAQTEAVGMLLHEPRSGGTFVGLPLQFDGARPAIRRPSPTVGQHNAEIIREPMQVALTPPALGIKQANKIP